MDLTKWNAVKNKCVSAIPVLRFINFNTKRGGFVELENLSGFENSLQAVMALSEGGFIKDDGGNFSITDSGIEAIRHQESLLKRG